MKFNAISDHKNWWPVPSLGKPHLRTPPAALQWALSNLLPKSTGYEYIRLGPQGDGGYVLPNDLSGVYSCYSPGVNGQIGFETELLNQFGISSHLCDEESKKTVIPQSFTYDCFWLADSVNSGFSTLAEWVGTYDKQPIRDLVLQMDIEGAEWQVLTSTPDDLLSRFRIIVVELHTFDKIMSWRRFQSEVKPFLIKLLRSHYVAYVHANNCFSGARFGELIIPEILELTFHRRDRIRAQPKTLRLPTTLDYECVPSKPELNFFESWCNYLGITDLHELSI